MHRHNVVLTGFMATGKTTVGRLLAAKLGYDWVDTDELIEDRHGPINEIFRSNGEEAFRELERQVAADLARRSGLVISTGGRMMVDPVNAKSLGASGQVFCLTAAPAEILRRVETQDAPTRPLLEGSSPASRIEEILEDRADAYAQFEQVSTDRRTFEEIVDDLIARLQR